MGSRTGRKLVRLVAPDGFLFRLALLVQGTKGTPVECAQQVFELNQTSHRPDGLKVAVVSLFPILFEFRRPRDMGQECAEYSHPNCHQHEFHINSQGKVSRDNMGGWPGRVECLPAGRDAGSVAQGVTAGGSLCRSVGF
jgi:hypothetical protein